MPVRPLDMVLAEKARVELFEDPKKLEDGIQNLKNWIDKQPHLRARKDDQWLAAFLRGCKFSLERCKEKIDLFYSLKSLAADVIVLKATDSKFLELIKSGTILILPKPMGPGGSRVIMTRAISFDYSKYTADDVVSCYHILKKILMMDDDNFVVSGAVYIHDFEGSSIAQFGNITPLKIKKILVVNQGALPLRSKGTHFLNAPKAFEVVYNIFRSFISEKLKNRVFLHSKSFESVYKYVPQDILPLEYGGNGGTVQEIVDKWVKKVQDYKAWLEEDEQFGTDETLRVGKPRTSEDMFGVEGSFRQLQFD